MYIEPEIVGCQLILIGKFNPAIFSPLWFGVNDIVAKEEAEVAVVELIHAELTLINFETFQVRIQPNMFSVDTSIAPYVKAADILTKTFAEFLPHTPITAAGINFHGHFRLPSPEARMALGRRMAPLDPWGEWGQRIAKADDDSARKGGVRVLAMHELWVDEPFKGHLQAQIEPSAKIPNELGVYVHINHHVQRAQPSEVEGGADLVNYMSSNFDAVMRQAEWLYDIIFSPKNTTP